MMTFSINSSYLFLETISLSMIIGAFENERHMPQPIEISVALEFDKLGAIESDRLESTYDYGQAYRLIKKLSQQPYTLVEYFAQECAKALLEQNEHIKSGEIIIAKPGAFTDIRRVGVHLKFQRSS